MGDNIGVCYQGKLDYIKECVAQRSPVGQAVYRSPQVEAYTTCIKNGYTKTTPPTNPDKYYGNHNVTIWFKEVPQDVRRFATRMVSSWPSVRSLLLGWGRNWR